MKNLCPSPSPYPAVLTDETSDDENDENGENMNEMKSYKLYLSLELKHSCDAREGETQARSLDGADGPQGQHRHSVSTYC